MNCRQRYCRCAGTQRQALIVSALGMSPAFKRRSRRTQNNKNVFLMGSPNGQITCRVAQPVLLLIRAVMLLVNNNQPQAGHGGKNGQPRAQQYISLPFKGGQPRLQPGPRSQS